MVETWTVWKHIVTPDPEGWRILDTRFAAHVRIETDDLWGDGFDSAVFSALSFLGVSAATHDLACDGPRQIWVDRTADGACLYTLDRGDTLFSVEK